jgi:hypothetical protein
VAFAAGPLRRTLGRPGERGPLGAWLVAFSLMGLDNLSDPIFRLDCMAADAGCTIAVAAASWPGTIHVLVGIGTGLLTVAAPFTLAREMRLSADWGELAAKTRAFGVVFALLFVLYVALAGAYGQGYAQRALALLAAGGLVVLARRVEAIARSSDPGGLVSPRS